jgi:hypothetical protein
MNQGGAAIENNSEVRNTTNSPANVSCSSAVQLQLECGPHRRSRKDAGKKILFIKQLMGAVNGTQFRLVDAEVELRRETRDFARCEWPTGAGTERSALTLCVDDRDAGGRGGIAPSVQEDLWLCHHSKPIRGSLAVEGARQRQSRRDLRDVGRQSRRPRGRPRAARGVGLRVSSVV